MANETNKTTEILEFKVDQGQGLTDLEKMRKTLIGLKEEQKQLNDAYKKGNITQEEYVKEITRVDAVLKKVSATHGTLQKNLTGVQSQTDKLIKSNANLSKSMTDAASQINVAGVNVGQLGTKLASLANPVTATVAIVGTLASVYAKSSIGAKDLAFAQNQLSASFSIVADEFAGMISSVEDGQGFFSKITDEILFRLNPALSSLSKLAAQAREDLDNVREASELGQIEINRRLAENAELLTDIANKELSAQQRQQAALQIQQNITANTNDRLEFIAKELEAYQNIRSTVKDTGDVDLIINKLLAERSALTTQEEKQKEKIQKQLNAILAAETKETEQLKAQTEELERQARIARRERELAGPRKSGIDKFKSENQVQAEEVSAAANAMAAASEALADRVEEANKRQIESNKAVQASQDARLNQTRLFSSEAARFFQTIDKDNRVLAAAQLAADAALTISGITKNAASLPPRQAAIYKASALLSAGASLAQAAKLLRTNAPNLGDGSSGGIGGGGDRGAILSSTLSGAGIGSAIGSVIPGLGTLVGGAIGGFVGFIGGLFGRRRGFASGGWTGPGDTYQPAGIVHADEYVTPKRVVNSPAAKPHIMALENMRLRGYATGGFVSTPGSDANALAEALSKVNIEVSVVEINKAQNKFASKVALTTR